MRLRRRLQAPELCGLLLTVVVSACSTVEFKRDTKSSGTFEATGTSFTIFSVDLPRSALNQARENASDAGLHNLVVTSADVYPHWGILDFLVEIIGIRYAVIRGTWGYSGD
jgi:hypothetical protein